jgi:hypothetical protein
VAPTHGLQLDKTARVSTDTTTIILSLELTAAATSKFGERRPGDFILVLDTSEVWVISESANFTQFPAAPIP